MEALNPARTDGPLPASLTPGPNHIRVAVWLQGRRTCGGGAAALDPDDRLLRWGPLRVDSLVGVPKFVPYGG
jgi:hypothetical protein